MTEALLDQPARDAARFELGRNIVVEAGAGTGKTSLLTERILFLLAAGGPQGRGIDITRIVALTFTEKAAAEIQWRLSSRLADLTAAIDGTLRDPGRLQECRRWISEVGRRFGRQGEELRRALAEASEKMERASIGTIHRFAAQLLRLHPLESGVDPAFEVDPGPAFEENFESHWQRWLVEELGEEAPRRESWLELLAIVDLEDLRLLARALCSEECAGATPASPQLERRLRALAEAFETFARKPAPARSKVQERCLQAKERLRRLAEAFSGGGALARRLPAPLKVGQWPQAWGEGEERELFEAGAWLAERASAESESLLRRAAGLLEPFCRRFRAEYSRRGHVGFSGLLRHARDLVRDDPDVRSRLKRRFDVLLIDEFQDTDPLQGELLLFLAERPGDAAAQWRKIRLEPGRLFIVGDPKQSIYRFRGADIRAYEEFARLLLEQGALRCDLQTSFRSHSGVIAPINAVFASAMRAKAGLQPPYLPIHPRPDGGGSAGVELVVFEEADEPGPRAEALRRAEAAWIARWISERDARWKFRDVAILMRSTNALDIYLSALRAQGIPYAVEADRRFFGTQEILDCVNLLRVLEDPGDAIALVGLLRSPAAALSDRDILELRESGSLSIFADPPEGLDREARRRACALFDELRGLRERVGREPLADFVRRAMRRTRMTELCAQAYHGEQTVSNLLKFQRIADEAADTRGSTLREFLLQLGRSIEDSAEEGESPLADDHLDAVRILTIHKAKGLEFPIVFLPNLGAPIRSGEPPVFMAEWRTQAAGFRLPKAKAADAAMALLQWDENRRIREESVRLLYVAMTRARERLFLLGAEAPGHAGTFSNILAAAGAWPQGQAGSLSIGSHSVPVRRVSGDRLAAPRRRRGEAWSVDARAWSRVWAARRAERSRWSGGLFASPTDYQAEIQKLPALEEGAGPPADWIGRLCHRVLEKWDFARPPDLGEALASACRNLAWLESGVPWKAVAEEGWRILEGFLESEAARELADSEILGREMPFLYPREGRVMRGSLDLLYRRGGKLWVADYKTGKPLLDIREALRRYGPQAGAYVEAVERGLGERPGFKLLWLRGGKSIELPI